MLMQNKLLFLITLLTTCGSAKQSTDDIRAISFSSYGFSYEKDTVFELRNNIKIAYYKDYSLYQTKTITLSPGPDNSSDTYIDLKDTVGVSTYKYFIIKKGEKKGLLFDRKANPKAYDLDIMLKRDGLNFKDFPFFCLDVGKPAQTEKNSTNGDVIEKFANPVKGPLEPDSLYRYYNTKLSDVNFTFCDHFDKIQQNKLWKIGLIYHKKEGKAGIVRREAYWKFAPYENDDQLFLTMFKQFIAQKDQYKLN